MHMFAFEWMDSCEKIVEEDATNLRPTHSNVPRNFEADLLTDVSVVHLRDQI